LLSFVIPMVLLVCSEVRSAPEGAVEGLWLRTQIKIAELIPSRNSIIAEVEQRPLSMTSVRHASKARTGKRHSSHVSSASRPAEEPASGRAAARVQVLPIRPLQPFVVEVVSGPQRRLVAARPSSVHVDILDEQSLFETDGSPAGSQAGTSPATLRALISPEGRVEDLWLVRGPRPAPATLDLLRQARYRPLSVNGIAMETEAFIIMDVPPQESQP
jgi:hypothetical protein